MRLATDEGGWAHMSFIWHDVDDGWHARDVMLASRWLYMLTRHPTHWQGHVFSSARLVR